MEIIRGLGKIESIILSHSCLFGCVESLILSVRIHQQFLFFKLSISVFFADVFLFNIQTMSLLSMISYPLTISNKAVVCVYDISLKYDVNP